MFCPRCGTETKDEAQFCHHCGAPLTSTTLLAPASSPTEESLSPATFRQRRPTVTVVTKTSRAISHPPSPTGSAAVRKGLTQAKFNDENSGVMMAEMTLIAIAAGLITSSWWWFGGVFLGLIAALNIRPLANVLAFVLSLGWGILGYGIGMFFDSQAASVVLGLLGFLCGLGLHLSALQWFRDV